MLPQCHHASGFSDLRGNLSAPGRSAAHRTSPANTRCPPLTCKPLHEAAHCPTVAVQCRGTSSDASGSSTAPFLSSMREPVRPRLPARTDDYSGTGLARSLSNIRKKAADKSEQSGWHPEAPVVDLTPAEVATIEHVDAQEMVAALSYVTRTRQPPNRQQLLPILEAAAPQLPTLSTEQLSEAVRCLGALGMPDLPQIFCDALLRQLQPRLAAATARQLAKVSWGLARLPGDAVAVLDEEWLVQYMAAVEACITGSQHVGQHANEQGKASASQPAQKGSEATATATSDFERASIHKPTIMPQQLASMLLLPVGCGVAPGGEWLAVVEQEAARQLQRSSVQDVSSIMYSLARLGLQPAHQPGGWLAGCMELLFDELMLLDAEQLAHATAALCVFEVVLPRHALQQLHAAAASALDPDSGPGSTVGALTLAPGVREAVGEALRRHLARLEELGASAAV